MNELIQTFFLVQYRIDFSNLVFLLVWIDCEKNELFIIFTSP